MAKIVITNDGKVWRVSRRVLGARTAMGPGMVIARSLIRLLVWPFAFVGCVLGLRPWRVEARTIEGRPVVWYVRGVLRARRVAAVVVDALVQGRSLDGVTAAVRARSTKP
jgi:hypothetical protein